MQLQINYGSEVYILGRGDEFSVDVLPLIPVPSTSQASWCGFRKQVQTCKASSLQCVGQVCLSLLRRNLRKGRLTFCESVVPEIAVPEGWHSCNAREVEAEDVPRQCVIKIVPGNIAEHQCNCPAVCQREDYLQRGRVFLDMPVPHLLDIRSWRCRTCLQSFSVTYEDVKRILPEALRHKASKSHKEIWFSPRWLIHTLLKFAETMNFRATKRYLLDTYASCVLKENQRWYLSSLPSCLALGAVIKRALGDYLPHLVKAIEFEVHAFAGGALRGDGHFKLPMRVRDSDKICLYGWLGSDAAVLSPPELIDSEKLPDLLPNLQAMASKLLPTRKQYG